MGSPIPLSAISEFVAKARWQLETTVWSIQAQGQVFVAAGTEPTNRPAYWARGRTRGWAPTRWRENPRASRPAQDLASHHKLMYRTIDT